MTPIDDKVRARIARFGPLPFAEVMELALYDERAGFYAAGGQAGRRGDFLTSPEVGPLFGAVVARALDRWWEEAGRPSAFVVVEAGAGPGTLARAVLNAEPACAAALRYVLVEVSAAQRAVQASRLPLEVPVAAFPAVPEPDDDARPVEVPVGPIVVSLGELPRLPGPCVVLANELLDNLPVGVAERTADGWAEVHVGVDGDELVDLLLPLDPTTAARLTAAAPAAPTSARLPLPRAASAWLREARTLAGPGGRVVAFDYGRPAAELARVGWTEWFRTYRQHTRGGAPLDALGEQDLTADVAFDLLDQPPTGVVTQGEWLRHHGIDELVAEGRRIWEERGHLGDLAALHGRSRIGEAEALLDAAGLGSFLVLEWRG